MHPEAENKGPFPCLFGVWIEDNSGGGTSTGPMKKFPSFPFSLAASDERKQNKVQAREQNSQLHSLIHSQLHGLIHAE